MAYKHSAFALLHNEGNLTLCMIMIRGYYEIFSKLINVTFNDILTKEISVWLSKEQILFDKSEILDLLELVQTGFMKSYLMIWGPSVLFISKKAHF